MSYRLGLVDKSKVLRLSRQGLTPTLISQRLGVSIARVMQIRKELRDEETDPDSREDAAEDGNGKKSFQGG